MANIDEVSRSILAFGIVAAIWIVLLIVICGAGENVGPNTPQAKRRVEIPAIDMPIEDWTPLAVIPYFVTDNHHSHVTLPLLPAR
jgi:hypothetical protein